MIKIFVTTQVCIGIIIFNKKDNRYVPAAEGGGDILLVFFKYVYFVIQLSSYKNFIIKEKIKYFDVSVR